MFELLTVSLIFFLLTDDFEALMEIRSHRCVIVSERGQAGKFLPFFSPWESLLLRGRKQQFFFPVFLAPV